MGAGDEGMLIRKVDSDIIIALADNNMNVSDTARALFMHRNTVVYHIAKIKKMTGLDPANFYDLHKLVDMVKRRYGNEVR